MASVVTVVNELDDNTTGTTGFHLYDHYWPTPADCKRTRGDSSKKHGEYMASQQLKKIQTGGGRSSKRKQLKVNKSAVIDIIDRIKSNESLNTSWRNVNSIWGLAAKELDWNNSLKHRKQLYQIWARRDCTSIEQSESHHELEPDEKYNDLLHEGVFVEKAKRIHEKITSFLSNHQIENPLPRGIKCTFLENIESIDISDDEEDKLANYICRTFKEFTDFSTDVSSLLYDTMKFIVNYKENTDTDSPIRKTKRRIKPNRHSSIYVYDDPIKKPKKSYCVCQKEYDFARGEDMVKCDQCGEWYHFPCIAVTKEMGKRVISLNKKVIFKCGFKGCNNETRFLKLDNVVIHNGPLEHFKEETIERKGIFNLTKQGSILNISIRKYKTTFNLNPELEFYYNEPFENYFGSILTSIRLVINIILQQARILQVYDGTLGCSEYIQIEHLLQIQQDKIDEIKSEHPKGNPTNDIIGQQCKGTTIFIQKMLELLDFLSTQHQNNIPNTYSKETSDNEDINDIDPNLYASPKETSDSEDIKDCSQNIYDDHVIDGEFSFDFSSTQKKNNNLHTSSDNECNNENYRMDNDTIEAVLDCKLPASGYFEKELQQTTSFEIDVNLWEALVHDLKKRNDSLRLQNKPMSRCFTAGEWQDLVLQGIKESNPFCVFIFKYHKVNIAKKLRHNSVGFGAHAVCKFDSCLVNLSLSMTNVPFMNVTYTGNVRHDISSMHARPLRKAERNKLKEIFRHGIKPSKLASEFMSKKKPEVCALAGNMDGIGVDKHTLQQISSESHQTGRMHKDWRESILLLKQKLDDEISSGIDHAFIQNVGLDPTFVYYWSSKSLSLWNSLAKKTVAYIDATGKVVRRSDTGTSFLYYEISFQNPIKKESTVPVAGALCIKQNQAQITDFLNQFRYSEKIVKGKKNIVQPKQINCDWGMAIILSLLDVFNRENFQDYLMRSWQIVSGGATNVEMTKTVIHVCLSHHMKIMKEKCLESGLSEFTFKMYFSSLLVNCKTISEAREVLLDGIVIMLSKHISDKLVLHSNRLLEKIKKMDSTISESIDIISDAGIEVNVEDNSVIYNDLTEEEEIHRSSTSPFKIWGDKLYSEAVNIVRNDKTQTEDLNSRFCPSFIDVLLKRYIPTIPLWSSMLLGDLRRHSAEYRLYEFVLCNENARTNSEAEQRFRMLKDIHLNGKTRLRIDDFSVELEKMFSSAQKSAALTCLKRNKFTKKYQQPQTLASESWYKPEKANYNLQGKYQRSPSTKIPVITTSNIPKKANPTDFFCLNIPTFDVSGMKNLGNTCWFNSSMQALSSTKLVTSLIEKSSADNMTSEYDNIICIWKHMKQNVGINIPIKLLHNLFKSETKSNMFNAQQQDSSEFLTSFVSNMADSSQHHIKINNSSFCKNCQNITSTTQLEFCDFLALPNDKNTPIVFIQELIQSNGTDMDNSCCICGTASSLSFQKTYDEIPQTFILVLKRYCQNSNGIVQKNFSKVIPDETIIIGESSFQLQSIVCHHGIMGNGGHYTAHVIKRTLSQTYLINCNDENICTTYFPETWPNTITRNCYILMYDKQHDDGEKKNNFKDPRSKGIISNDTKELVLLPDVELNEFFIEKKYGKHIISKSMIEIILSTQWFDSDIIDAYMSLLNQKLMIQSNIKVVKMDPGWLLQRFFFDCDPNKPKPNTSKSKRTQILMNTADYVVIPANVFNNHWILVIINLSDKQIIYGNSTGEYYTYITDILKDIFVEKHKWEIVKYHEGNDFPLQEDDFSCGPYVCSMAKAILFKQKFRFHPIMTRNTIAHELMENEIF